VTISDYLRRLREIVGHELLVLPSVTAAVFDADERILLVRVADRGLWVLPGGSVDPDESPTDAVVRETREEAGLDVEPVRIVGAYGGPEFRVTYSNGDRVSYVMTVYECRRLGGAPRPDGHETVDARFFSREEAGAVVTAPWCGIVVADAFAMRRR
jgi:8-oxo-dGTP pyrophosphatase MutT (NUDIX family)